MNVHTAGTLTIHYTCSISRTSIDCLYMHFTDVGHQGKVRPGLANEVEAYKLFPVFEVFRFDSQVGFCSNLSNCSVFQINSVLEL